MPSQMLSHMGLTTAPRAVLEGIISERTVLAMLVA